METLATTRSTSRPYGLWCRSRIRPSRPRSAAPSAPASPSSRSTRARTCRRDLGDSPTSGSARRRRATRSASAWRRPASSARCASSRSCATTRSTSAAPGSRAACGRAGRPRAHFVLDVKDPAIAAPKLRAELASRRADGVLTLSSDAARTALEAKKEGGRATAAKFATFDLSPRSSRRSRTGACCSRSTSRPTCRATCRS